MSLRNVMWGYIKSSLCVLVSSLNVGSLRILELFGSTEWKLDLPHGVDCTLHRPDIVKHSIPCPNTQSKITCIEKSLNIVEHGGAHTTYVLETNNHFSQLQDCCQSLPKDFGLCMPINDFMHNQSHKWQTWHPNANKQRYDEGVLLYWQCGVWVLIFPSQHQKLCELQHKKFVVDEPIVPIMWTMEMNLSKLEMLMLEDVGFQL